MNINFNTLSKGLSVVKTVAMNRRSEILLGTALTSSLLSTVLAGKAGYEARGRVVEYEHPSVDFKEPEAELTFKEKAMLTWDCYIPAGLTNLTTLGSVSALHAFHHGQARFGPSSCLSSRKGQRRSGEGNSTWPNPVE